jgi:hypothetical protein
MQHLEDSGTLVLYIGRTVLKDKRTKASSTLCSCPEMEEQTALHLLKDCTPFTKVRPAAFQTLTLPTNNTASHKHQNSVQPNQRHLPHATATIAK